ncbi:MAG: ABC transporter substrate-binding protein [Arachnia sp.]
MKLKATILGAALTALALTACGGEAATPAQPGGTNSPAAPATGGGAPKAVKIGAITFVTHDALDAAYAGFVEGMKEAGYEEGKNLTIDSQNPQADQGTLSSIVGTFASSDYDAFYAIATPPAQALAAAITDRPIVFAAVTDPVAAGLTASWDAPDANVTGASDLNPMKEQLELIREALPEAKTVGIVYSSGEVNSEVQVSEAEKYAADLGFEIKTATITNSSEVQQAAESLNVDAYLIPTDNVVVSAAETVLQVAADKGSPVFGSDEATVKRGAAAGLSVNYTQQGRDAAAIMVKLLNGTPASEIPVETQKQFDLFVNETGAAAQGLTLPEAIVSRATEKF